MPSFEVLPELILEPVITNLEFVSFGSLFGEDGHIIGCTKFNASEFIL